MTDSPSETVVPECLILPTIKAARALVRRYDAELKPFGVTVIQFSAMLMIRQHAGWTIHALAERMGIDRSALTRNIDLLVRKGLVAKEPAKSGRAKVCRLTPAGEARMERLMPEWYRARTELHAQLAPHDPETVLAGLRQLAEV